MSKGLNVQNEILRKRIITLIAMSYAINFEDLWGCYKKLNDINKLLNLLETNKLNKYLKEKTL